MGKSDYWQLTTGNCFSKSFQGPHTGCGWRRHDNLVLAIWWYCAGLAFRKGAGHVCIWYSPAQRFSTTLGKFIPSQNGNWVYLPWPQFPNSHGQYVLRTFRVHL